MTYIASLEYSMIDSSCELGFLFQKSQKNPDPSDGYLILNKYGIIDKSSEEITCCRNCTGCLNWGA